MKLKMIVMFIFLLAVVSLSGCTHFQQALIGEEKAFPETKPENVEVFFSSDKPQHSFQEVSFIVVEENSEKEAVEFLKKKAASVGADALLNCEVKVFTYVVVFIIIPIPINSFHAAGVAVKYTN